MIRYALVIGIEELEKNHGNDDPCMKNLRKVIIEDKHYTYSKFNYFPKNICSEGFYNVKRAELLFSTPLPDKYFTYFLELFNDYNFIFRFEGHERKFYTNFISKIEEPKFSNRMSFITKSPIAVCTKWYTKFNTERKHFFNYTKYKEKKKFISRVKETLIKKYEDINGNIYTGNNHLFFSFDKK